MTKHSDKVAPLLTKRNGSMEQSHSEKENEKAIAFDLVSPNIKLVNKVHGTTDIKRDCQITESCNIEENVNDFSILSDIRKKHPDNVIISQLNINSIRYKI